MDVSLPPGYTKLCDVSELDYGSNCTVMGVVTDWMPPAPTKGTDWTCKFSLMDPSLCGSWSTGVSVRLFIRHDKLLRRSPNVGDFAVIRKAQLKEVYGVGVLVETRGAEAEFLFFPKPSVPDEAFGAAHLSDENRQIDFWTLPGRRCQPLSAQEQASLMKMNTWAKENAALLPQPVLRQNNVRVVQQQKPPKFTSKIEDGRSTGPSRPVGVLPKFSFLKDVEVGKFHAVVGEVRRLFVALNCVEVFITDYTYNPLFYDYKDADVGEDVGRDGDPHGYTSGQKREWNGPWGKHTIKVTLWEPHATVGKALKEGDLVYIDNARFTQKESHYLQASVHEDRKEPDRLHIKKLKPSDDWAVPLLELSKKYWEGRENQKKPISRGKKKKQRQEKKGRQKGAQLQQEAQAAEDELFVPEARDELNKSVAAASPEQLLIPLSNVVENPHRTYRDRHGKEQTLPFVNMKCRTRVRVIDFYPPDLADFSRCLDHVSYNDKSSQLAEPTPMDYDGSSPIDGRWEWAFYLLVEDARQLPPGQPRSQLPLLVHGKDAEYLLNMTATDLHYNGQILNMLKRKLFLLWGDLEELKASGKWSQDTKPSNKPFECCIKEYGVQDGREWRRVHRIFQTTIHGTSQ